MTLFLVRASASLFFRFFSALEKQKPGQNPRGGGRAPGPSTQEELEKSRLGEQLPHGEGAVHEDAPEHSWGPRRLEFKFPLLHFLLARPQVASPPLCTSLSSCEGGDTNASHKGHDRRCGVLLPRCP